MEDKNERQVTEHMTSNGATNGVSHKKRGGIVNTLYPPGEKPGAVGRYKNHCRKFWWCDLLVIAVITLVIVLPLIYVGIPNKAQHDLNASTLEVTEQDVTSPTPDQVHLKLVSVAKSSSSFHPTIEGFRGGLSLENQDPFTYIDIPETKAQAETNILVEQDIKFASRDQFIAYNKAVIGSETFKVELKGKTKIHQKGLHAISVDYNKVVTMKGLNKLAGLNITDVKILSLNETVPGVNMKGNVFIPNPSVMSISLGNVTMDISLDGGVIGNSSLPDLTLRPGDNNIKMSSYVDQGKVISWITANKKAVLPLDIVGNSSVYNGQHLDYFEAAIRSNTMRVNLDVTDALASMGLNVSNIIGS